MKKYEQIDFVLDEQNKETLQELINTCKHPPSFADKFTGLIARTKDKKLAKWHKEYMQRKNKQIQEQNADGNKE